MSDNTHIEWSDATWNFITGCSIVSAGCTNCYAMRLAGTRLKHHPTRVGLTKDTRAGPVWTGEVRFNEGMLTDPLRWTRPRKIFPCAHGDMFAEGVPDEWIDRGFAVMAVTPHHSYQVLTKRPGRAYQYLTDPKTRERIATQVAALQLGKRSTAFAFRADHFGMTVPTNLWPLPNVWLGTSVEDQKRAEERIPLLLATPAAVRWISAEPLLGPMVLTQLRNSLDLGEGQPWLNALGGYVYQGADTCSVPRLDWVVVGGESGPGARPMHPAWARSLRDQCEAAGTAYLFKQHGAWAPLEANDGQWPTSGAGALRLRADGSTGDDGWPMQNVGKKAAGRLLDGREWNGYPA